MYDFTTLQKIYKKIICKLINHTHTFIILHLQTYCNTFFRKTVDNFFIFEKINF